MKRLLLIFIITLSLQSWTKADDIRDFQIEGISIGDSLLDYFSKKQIENFGPVTYPSSEKFIGWETSEDIKFKDYDEMTFYVKKNDKNYKIYSMKGMKSYPDKLKQCLKKKKEIVKIIEDILEFKEIYNYDDDYAGTAGKSIAYITDFDLSNGGVARVWCSVWDKNHKTSKYWKDDLSVGINTKEFFDWLNNEAY